jgi:hypothetical protein
MSFLIKTKLICKIKLLFLLANCEGLGFRLLYKDVSLLNYMGLQTFTLLELT